VEEQGERRKGDGDKNSKLKLVGSEEYIQQLKAD